MVIVVFLSLLQKNIHPFWDVMNFARSVIIVPPSFYIPLHIFLNYMQLVKQVQFKRSKLLDEITFLSKSLFNMATYTVRQRFFKDRYWIRYHELWNVLKSHESYQKLQEACGSHPPQQVLKQVDRNFKSFFKAIKQWKSNPSTFTGRPKLPHYKR